MKLIINRKPHFTELQILSTAAFSSGANIPLVQISADPSEWNSVPDKSVALILKNISFPVFPLADIRKGTHISGSKALIKYFDTTITAFDYTLNDKLQRSWWQSWSDNFEQAMFPLICHLGQIPIDESIITESKQKVVTFLDELESHFDLVIKNLQSQTDTSLVASDTDSIWVLGGSSISSADGCLYGILTLFFGPGSSIFADSYPAVHSYYNALSQSKYCKTAWDIVGYTKSQDYIDAFCEYVLRYELHSSIRLRHQISPIPTDPIYITTPIYYATAGPHIGHIYSTLLADVISRWWKLRGAKVWFMTGTDEHGQKIAETAEKFGVSPKKYTDDISSCYKDVFQQMEFQYDHFIRTTDENHKVTVLKIWNRLWDGGYIYKGTHNGWYCVADEAYYTDIQVEDVTVTVPDPSDPTKTIETTVKQSKETGGQVQWVAEENYFFKLSQFKQPLLDYIKKNPEWIQPTSRKSEVIHFLENIRDLSVSRNKISWGIPIPQDPEHVMYVWADALTNYLTSAGFPHFDPSKGSVPAHGPKTWPADYQILGKDILRFHAVYWPAILLASGIELPKRLYVHGWWTKDKCKISKRLGNVLDPVETSKKYGLDALKFLLLREGRLNQDCDYSDSLMEDRLNGDLADTLGNTVNRSATRALNATGKIPAPNEILSSDEKEIIKHVLDMIGDADHAYINMDFPAGIESVLDSVRAINKFVQDSAPWTLRKSSDPVDHARCDTVLYITLESLRIVSILLSPIMPNKMKELQQIIGADPSLCTASFENLSWGKLVPGTPLGPTEADGSVPILFPKISSGKPIGTKGSKGPKGSKGGKPPKTPKSTNGKPLKS